MMQEDLKAYLQSIGELGQRNKHHIEFVIPRFTTGSPDAPCSTRHSPNSAIVACATTMSQIHSVLPNQIVATYLCDYHYTDTEIDDLAYLAGILVSKSKKDGNTKDRPKLQLTMENGLVQRFIFTRFVPK